MANLKIFADNVEPTALDQIYTLVKNPAFSECKVRIMPDVHAGKGCVIGFTADLGEKVIPNIVGVDIGCGMLTINLGNIEMDFDKLDGVIRKHVPNGKNVHEGRVAKFDKLQSLKCFRELKDTKRIERSIGTLGGGNHFIEVDVDDENNKYLIIHSGSRNLGKQVAEYYQNLAVESMQGMNGLREAQDKLITKYREFGEHDKIEKAIKELKRKFAPNLLRIPKELCYLTGTHRVDYLHDMKICQEYASLNRKTMQLEILERMSIFKYFHEFETVHNYIDHDTNIVRKGAVSARKDEMLLIPINMRDGCIIGIGKGNDDWNQSAPHGAGRLMSRSKAKEIITLDEYEKSMNGIYSTSVNAWTIDESPMAYKTMDEIISNIGETVEIVKIIKPVYNFKASE